MAACSDQPIPASGLTVIVCPDKPDIDVVFVHGFTGHPYTTWLDKRVPETPDKKLSSRERLRSKFGRSSASASSSTQPPEPLPSGPYWPRDLVPTVLPNARVLTYGYDTHIRHRLGPPGSKSSVYDIGGDFLLELEAKREQGGRPILFIAHSLGGIVVKETLRRSWGSRQLHLKDICNSTAGITFFGTPHGGADPRRFLHRIAEKTFRAVGAEPNEAVISSLLPSSERLAELRDEFPPIAAERNWAIQSFQEDIPVQLLGGKVVEDPSSCLNLPMETKQHIRRNHMNMCRFSGPGDVEFEKVAAVLRRMSSHALTAMLASQTLPEAEVPALPTIEMPDLAESQREKIRAALAFDQMDDRLHNITAQHPKTCAWLPEHEAFLDWLNDEKLPEHSGFLWLKGKPGVGKSTLMKYLLKRFRGTLPGHGSSLEATDNDAVISFFFNRRGSELEQSTLGLYRSILLQLLENFPPCWELFSLDTNQAQKQERLLQTSEECLRDLILSSVESIIGRKAIIFIDALDECDEDQVRDMISFFETLVEAATAKSATLRFCFASRHYPSISLRRGRVVKLDDQEGHSADIRVYVNSKLNIGQGHAAASILEEIIDKSQGIFMWAVLVIRILNKKYDQGRINALRETLEALPPGLHELFHDIFKKDHEADDIEEVVLCLQWIVFAKEALSPLELYYAIQSGLCVRAVGSDQVDELADERHAERYILDASRGLAEITTTTTTTRRYMLTHGSLNVDFCRKEGIKPLGRLSTRVTERQTVQLIHESVGEFLRKEGLGHLTDQPSSSIPGASHEQLKTCCMNAIIAAERSFQRRPPGRESRSILIPVKNEELRRKYPSMNFLLRALAEVLYHADKAQGLGHPQIHFLESFDTPQWIALRERFEENDSHNPDAMFRGLTVFMMKSPIDLDLACVLFDYPHLYSALWATKVGLYGPLETVRRLPSMTVDYIIICDSVNMLSTVFRLALDSLGVPEAFSRIQLLCSRPKYRAEPIIGVDAPEMGTKPQIEVLFVIYSRLESDSAFREQANTYFKRIIECASRRLDGRDEVTSPEQIFGRA